ncbi:MAG: hypothetical protein JWN69_886 [Alphaproteobacteria bacterium]|nr:hypothetical protein [Alphaproteobacteria bacterium]
MLVFDTVGVKGLYPISGEASPVGLGLQVQLDFHDRAALVQTEVRLIAEMESETWWAQGNVMLRLLREEGGTAIGPAYAMSLQHKLGANAWLGVEGSGQFEPLSGDDTAAHFLGPSLTLSVARESPRSGRAGLCPVPEDWRAGPTEQRPRLRSDDLLARNGRERVTRCETFCLPSLGNVSRFDVGTSRRPSDDRFGAAWRLNGVQPASLRTLFAVSQASLSLAMSVLLRSSVDHGGYYEPRRCEAA